MIYANTIQGTFLVNGQRVELPDSTGAMLGFQKAPDITGTPFATDLNATNTLGKRGPTSDAPLGDDAACRGLASRVKQYGDLDPIPQVRKALIEKCEAYQHSRGAAIASSSSEEGPAPSGMDPKLIAAGAVAVLVVGAIALKKLKR